MSIRTEKTTRKLPRRVSEMSKEVLEATIRKKKDCNSKASAIVQRLVEETVDENWFLDCLKFISDSHYQDVTEERAITKLCGYPLCSKKLKDIPNQQYHISAKLNKVYDITERKNFCSNQCYKASVYLKNQLLTSPLWLRDNEEIPKFLLISVHSASGGVGKEVDIGQINPLREELKQLHNQVNPNNFTSVSDFMNSTLSKLASDIDKAENKNKKKNKEILRHKDQDTKKTDATTFVNHSTHEQSGEIKQKHEINKETVCTENNTFTVTHNSVECMTQNVQDSGVINKKQDSHSTEMKQISMKYESQKLNDSLSNVSNCLEAEFPGEQNKNNTISISEPPINDIKVNDTIKNELLSSKDTSLSRKQTQSKKKRQSKKPSNFTHPSTSAVIHIEKCLYEWFTFESMCFLFGEEKMKEMVSDKGECIKEYYKAINNASWDPKIQEQYMSICRRLNLMELEENQLDNNIQMPTKPLPDYAAVEEVGKKMELKVKAFYQGKISYQDVNVNSNTDTNNGAPTILPIVDLHAQKCLRRKIVRDRLNRVIPDMLQTFGLSCDVTKEVRNLVATFTLEAHNINFQPLEWNLIGMIIIKMLSLKDTRLRILLDSEEVTKYITMMLMVFQQDGGYLDRLMSWLTDLDNLLHKQ